MAPAPASSSPSAAWLAIARFTVCVLFLSFILSLLALPWVNLPWWRIARRCVSIAAVLSLWVCLRRFEHRPLRCYGFAATGGAGKRQFALGLLLGVGACAAILALGFLCRVYRIDVVSDRLRLWRVMVTFAPAAVLIGFIEEIVFRGFLLQHLLAWSTRAAVALTSLAYAAVHVKTLGWSLSTGLELAGLALLCALLALSYLRTGQLYLAIGLHAALAYGVRVGKLFIDYPEPPAAWLFGTSRVINGVVSWMVLLGISGLVLLWNAQRSVQGGTRHG